MQLVLWGKAFCDEAYKNLFRYTVEYYLRDDKEINNFLYINGLFVDEADYLSRYPGDEFIDNCLTHHLYR